MKFSLWLEVHRAFKSKKKVFWLYNRMKNSMESWALQPPNKPILWAFESSHCITMSDFRVTLLMNLELSLSNLLELPLCLEKCKGQVNLIFQMKNSIPQKECSTIENQRVFWTKPYLISTWILEWHLFIKVHWTLKTLLLILEHKLFQLFKGKDPKAKLQSKGNLKVWIWDCWKWSQRIRKRSSLMLSQRK